MTPWRGTVDGVDVKAEIREFLTTRRAKLTPAVVGLADYGPRRVPGLRREEVAVLAGVSIQYYTRMERGDMSGVSDSVLDALARGLRLDDAERLHLFDLARSSRPPVTPARRAQDHDGVSSSVQHMLDAMAGSAAVVRNDRMDIVGANHLGRALYCQLYDDGSGRANTARFCFLDPRAHDFFVDWERSAGDITAILHSAAGRNPDDHRLTELIDELATESEDFRAWWARHDVRLHVDCDKHYRHPVVGELHLTFESMTLTSAPGLSVVVYTPEPGSPHEDSMRLLDSWAATLETQPAPAPARLGRIRRASGAASPSQHAPDDGRPR